MRVAGLTMLSTTRVTALRLLIVMVLSCLTSSGCGRSPGPGKLSIQIEQTFPKESAQWAAVKWQFQLQHAVGNPYDPEEIRVDLRLICPDGTQILHPAFYVEEHEVMFDHGKEVVRKQGRQHWEIRWTPEQSGQYHWAIIAKSGGQETRIEGTLSSNQRSARGFVRRSEKDSRYFEFADGSFFYPIGHVLRSPSETRWGENDVGNAKLHQQCMDEKTFAYDRWFERMAGSGENFCSLWMTPWWLGLEWSRSFPGYEGLGRYNQIHAAQLDRIVESAERHGIFLMLFVMNHGQFSSVVDAEWDRNPYNRLVENGLVVTASDFFTDSRCLKKHQDKMRYILARWGYSTSLFGLSLFTESDWLEPYHGARCDKPEKIVDSVSYPNHPITAQKEMVNEWLAQMSSHIKDIDMHGHVVTTQFSQDYNGREAWPNPAFDVILNNCYFDDRFYTSPNASSPSGLVDAIARWSESYRDFDKPQLIAEWGGNHLRNTSDRLKSDLHKGIWALAMTDCAGCTGFWWWNEVDHKNLYEEYRALTLFLSGHDRRGKNLTSSRPAMSISTTPRDAQQTAGFALHPTRSAVMLSGETEAFAYIYHHLMDATNVQKIDDPRFEQATNTYVSLPSGLQSGTYRIEFWNTFDGSIIESFRRNLDGDASVERRVPLPRIRTDVAMKAIRIGDQTTQPE